MKLHTEDVRGNGAPTKSVLFLHGILGQGSNLRTVARRVMEARPGWQAVLVDLRGHGKSLGREGVDSLEGCADDVMETTAALALSSVDSSVASGAATTHSPGGALPPVAAVVGHSFGGKVAMLLASRMPSLEQVVLLDSAPGTRLDFRGSELTMQVLSTLEKMPERFPTREAFTRHLETALTKDLAQWLAMSLVREGNDYRFGPEVRRIRALLDSYFSTDCWPSLEALVERGSPRLHFVVGGRSLVYDEQELAHARALDAGLTVLPNAGHWVHVDDLDGTVGAIVNALPG